VTAVGIAALLLAPGTLLARLLARTSWLQSVALGPPLSVLLLSIVGAVLGLARIPATPLSTGALVVLALSAVWLVLRRTVRDRPSAAGQDDRWTCIGAGIAAVLAATVWGQPSGWLARPPQSWDYLWHQYVVATISRRGLLGPQNLVPVDGYADAIHTYQHGAHLAAGLVVGDGVPAVAAGLNLTLWLAVVVILPLGVATLTRSLTDDRVAVLLAPAIAVLLPNAAFSRLGLFAFVVGLAMLPAVALAGVIQSRERSVAAGVLLTLCLTGLLLVHAHAFLAAGLLLVALWVGGLVSALVGRREAEAGPFGSRAGTWWRSAVALGVPVVVAPLLAAPWLFLATGIHGTGVESGLASAEQLRDAGFDGVGAAFRALLTGRRMSPDLGPASPVLGVAVPLAALYLAWRRKHLGLVFFLVAFAAMTVVVAGGSGWLRELVATPWLGDWWRPAVVLSIAGALVLALAIGDATGRLRSSQAPGWARSALAAVLILPVALALLGQIPDARAELAVIHGPLAMSPSAETVMDPDTLRRERTADHPLMVISPLEVQAMSHLAEVTPPGTRVLNWWGDGSPWMYSAAGLVPTRVYASQSVSVRDALLVDEALGDPARYDEAIDALVTLDVCSAYAAAGHVPSRGLPDPPAWKELTDLPGFELVHSNEHARVYRAADPRLTKNC
jgi:hypothetical protein